MIVVLSIGITGFAHYREFQKSNEYENWTNNQTAAQANQIIGKRIGHFVSLAKSLAARTEFRNPADHARDRVRFMRRDRRQATQVAFYDHITTWLGSEFGSAMPLSDYRYLPRTIGLWQLTRGLPIRSPAGALIARPRRLLAEEAMSVNPEIHSIAELDAHGRVVFLYPYQHQITLHSFRLSPPLALPDARSGEQILFQRSLVGEDAATVLMILVPFNRSTGVYYLLTTLKPALLALPEPPVGSLISFGVFNKQGDLLMHAGKVADLAAANTGSALSHEQHTARFAISIAGSDYSLITVTPTSQVREAIKASFVTTIATYGISFILINMVIRRILLWLTREQWKRDRLRSQVEKAAEDLAHDFRKGVLILRTTKDSVSHKLDAGELQRLEGVITDITGYADHLSRNLATDTFALREVPGGVSSPRTEATTYLRGTLENVIEQQLPRLKHDIPLRLNEEIVGDEPFAGISPTDLTRIMSNVLDNAIDACTAINTHDISVYIQVAESNVFIRVVDNGCGIDPAYQSQLFNAGFTTKGAGRGKGLNSCQKLAEKWNGSLRLLRSVLGEGTEMELRIPKRRTPSWFVNKVVLTGKSRLVVVDDEGPVCDYWEKRFKERFEGIDLPSNVRPQLTLIRRAEDLRGNSKLLKEATYFFIDYKFDGETVTGIELIEELHLEDRAILVTNHFGQGDVLDAVERLGIRLLPKTYMFSIKFPIEIGGAP